MTETLARPRDYEIRGRVPLTDEQLDDLAGIISRAPATGFTYEHGSGMLSVRGHHEAWGSIALVLARVGRFAERVGVVEPRFTIDVHKGLTEEEAKAALIAMGMPWPDDDESAPAAASAA